MPRLPPHLLLGLFTLLTGVLAGVALGHRLGFSIAESMYLTLLMLAAISGWVGRRMTKG